MTRPLLAVCLALIAFTAGVAAQVPDSVKNLRAEVRCGNSEGVWVITLVLDSAFGPSYPTGRSAHGTLSLSGLTAWAPFNRDYPCRSAGSVSLDQRPLWKATRHPITKEFGRVPDRHYQEAWLDWFGPPGSDSVIIHLGTTEAGTFWLRGQTTETTMAGTWDLLTCDVCDQSGASGRFVAIRRRAP
jgi:hypothetical protein